MENPKNDNKQFTAADIEKYHKGQLSPKEMHALEKAALDDAFLADALEGYAVTRIEVNSDIAELEKRLADKTEKGKVIPIDDKRRASFPWLRAAAMIVVIASAGLFVYQFAFNKESNDIAQSKSPNEEIKTTDSNSILPQTKINDTSLESGTTISVQKEKTTSESGEIESVASINDRTDKSSVIPDSVANNFANTDINMPVATAPAKVSDNTKISDTDDAKEKETALAKKEEDKSKVADQKINNDAIAGRSEGVLSREANANRQGYTRTNYFRGRVTDANNNPLPFANITNTTDNVGTYSDAKGNFTLVSPDSVLDVQVRSLGFENSNIRLRNNVSNNQIMLKDDRSLTEVIVSRKKINSSRSRDANMKFEEPEPADGWEYYDTYLANNLNIPETFETKPTGGSEVEVSFEVNKVGEPVNIKVEKSLCDKCDKEAIRLVKEGPKWKRKAKKGKRTSVTISF